MNFSILSTQSAADCFCMGKTINQFRRFCLPLPASPAPLGNNSDPSYNSISSIEIEEDHKEPHLHVSENQPQEQAAQNDEGFIFEVNINTDHYRLCKAKQAHDSVLGKLDTSWTKKARTATEAPQLDTNAVIAKLDKKSKMGDLDVSTILIEQSYDPVLGYVRCWKRKGKLPNGKSPEIQQSKVLISCCQELDRFLIEAEDQLLCCNEPLDKLNGIKPSHWPPVFIMAFEINIKCTWQQPATNNLLKITKTECSETDQPIVITVSSLRQLQLGIWKLPIKQASQEMANLVSALHEYSVFAKFINTHRLTRNLVKELHEHC